MLVIGQIMDDTNRSSLEEQDNSSHVETKEEKTARIVKLRNQIVCICKGIRLAAVLKGLKGSSNKDEVNRKTGCGTGGCKGERCGPKIEALLKKYQSKKS